MKVCSKCGKEYDEATIEDPLSTKYVSCNDCWKEWTTYAVMVINEMRFDMSYPEHRKALKKHERVFLDLITWKKLKRIQKTVKIKQKPSSECYLEEFLIIAL